MAISFLMVFNLLITAALIGGGIYLFILLIRALRKYTAEAPMNEERKMLCASLGEVLKLRRAQCQMTQDEVAQKLGVTRQAVSKWENGKADPSTSNLVAMSRLYGVSADELLREVETK